MIDYQKITPLFPNPLYSTNIGRKFSNQELKLIEYSYINKNPQISNWTSKDKYILEKKEFEDLKYYIQKELDAYLEGVVKPRNKDLSLRITNSWLSFTHKDQNHSCHNHPNSYLSGVLYINTLDNDSILFEKSEMERLLIVSDEYSLLNSNTYRHNVKDGDLIIFPSNLRHSVLTNTTEQVRISMSFNTWITGKVGDLELVSELESK